MAEEVSDMVLVVQDDDPASPFHGMVKRITTRCKVDDVLHENLCSQDQRKIERATKLFETAQDLFNQNKFEPCLTLVTKSLAIHPTLAGQQLHQATKTKLESMNTAGHQGTSKCSNLISSSDSPAVRSLPKMSARMGNEFVGSSPVDSRNNPLPVAPVARSNRKKPIRLKRSESVTSRQPRKPMRLSRSRSLQTRISWPKKELSPEDDAATERKRFRHCADAPFEFDAVRGALDEEDETGVSQHSQDSFFTQSTLRSGSSSRSSRTIRRTASLDMFDREFDLSPDNPNILIRKAKGLSESQSNRSSTSLLESEDSYSPPMRMVLRSATKNKENTEFFFLGNSQLDTKNRSRRFSSPAGLLRKPFGGSNTTTFRSLGLSTNRFNEMDVTSPEVENLQHEIFDETARMDSWDPSSSSEKAVVTPLPNARLDFDATTSCRKTSLDSNLNFDAFSNNKLRQQRFRANLESAQPPKRPMSNRFRRCMSELTPKASQSSNVTPQVYQPPQAFAGLAQEGGSVNPPICFATPTREELLVSSLNMSVDPQVEACVRSNIKIVAIDFDQTLVKVHTSGRWNNRLSDLCQQVRPVFRCLIPALVKAGIIVAIATFSPQNQLIRNVVKQIFPELPLDDKIFVRCSTSTLTSPIEEEFDDKENTPFESGPTSIAAQVKQSNKKGKTFLEKANRFLNRKPFKSRQSTLNTANNSPVETDMDVVVSPEAPTLTGLKLNSLEEASTSFWSPEANGKRSHLESITRMCTKAHPELEVRPQDMLLIDDDSCNVAVAKQDGYRAVRFIASEGSITAEDHLMRSLASLQ